MLTNYACGRYLFRLSWVDMKITQFPAELRGRKFTVRFGWLNKLLQDLFGVFPEKPTMDDHTSDIMYDVESDPDSAGAAMERERLWAVEAKCDSGKIESDDSWQ